jgi:hypothetical protein
MRPPPAAFEACQGKKADDACEVNFRDRKLAGKCAPMEEGQLFCRPAFRGPPPEAREACVGKAEGYSCTVTSENGERPGQCSKGPGGELLCRPQQ